MVKATIQIFCRVKPPRRKQPVGHYDIEKSENGGDELHFLLPKDSAVSGYVNNSKESYKGRFQCVFDVEAKQEEIFDVVAKPVIENVLSGYNGTIFAYGQTGSGKTFTITGGPEKYADRGIIPRSISHIFQEFEKRTGYLFTLHVSYLEIYNNHGYDLLDPRHEISKLEDLPKVTLMEDTDHNVHLKNLSMHLANTEEEALNLLFLGDTNRMIAETPMNQASTRSHCIFTIHVTAREHGAATIRRAKMHLVDLAGSERVAKTNVNGKLLDEAKYINASLHMLELVIISLSENKSHVPYRNSMMTNVLKDSLGGNCMTTMVATCSVEKASVDESISTVRFSQRVAMIKNDVTLNEELDPKLIIAKLKRETEELKNQLHLATGGKQSDEPLEEYEKERCLAMVRAFVEDSDTEAVINVGADMRKINECFKILKRMLSTKGERGGGDEDKDRRYKKDSYADRIETSSSVSVTRNANRLNDSNTSIKSPIVSEEHFKRLQDLLLQRDNEITILVNMLKREKEKQHNGFPVDLSRPLARPDSVASDDKEASLVGGNRRILGDLSVGRQQAFEMFKRDYADNGVIAAHKEKLKANFRSAKELGEKVNASRETINRLKAQIEHYRVSLAMSGAKMEEDPDETETLIRDKVENEKRNYRFAFAQLKELKAEIEHQQHVLEKARVKLQKDFETWWGDQVKSAERQKAVLNSSGAWMNPVDDATVRQKPSVTASNGYHGAIPSKGRTKTRSLTPVQASTAPPPLPSSVDYDDPSFGNEVLDVPPTSHSTRSLPNRPVKHQLQPLENRSAPSVVSAPAKSRAAADGSPSSSGVSTSPSASLPKTDIPTALPSTLSSKSASTCDSNSLSSSQSLAAPKNSLAVFDIPLTGDSKADADIMAFIKARARIKAATRDKT